MPAIQHLIRRFLSRESGAIASEYVVLAAGITAVGLASAATVNEGLAAYSDTAESEMRGQPVQAAAGLSYADGFDNGAYGWSGAGSYRLNGVGNVLGPIAGSGGAIALSREFTIDDSVERTTMTFDLLAMDSLDAESGIVFIGGYEVGRVTRDHQGDSTFQAASAATLAERGISIEAGEFSANEDFGGNGKWTDQRTSLSITLDRVNDAAIGTVAFGFGSTANQGTDDESFSIDNFQISGLADPDA